jgi:CheY-like chemotaxis protein
MSDKAKVVMIDDETDLCAVVKDNLEETGKFIVETLSNPLQAEEFIRAQKPEIILLDVVMPQRGGPSVVQALKKDPELKTIPVIIVSGKGEMVYNRKKDEFKWSPNSKIVQSRSDLPDIKGAEALAEFYGVADYLSKPFTTDILVQVLEDVLARYRKSSGTDEVVEE